MPELPEVETIVQGLKRTISGYTITSLHLSKFKLRLPFSEEFAHDIIGMKISEITRRAKYILLELDGGITIVMHLGMSGRISVGEESSGRKHDHAIFTLLGPYGAVIDMVFNDPRRFGLVTAINTTALKEHKLFAELGIEPLTKDLSAELLLAQCYKRNAPIKSIIMNNAVVVGVGNIYASESLFLAGIIPTKPACSLSLDECDRLVVSIKRVLIAAINSGGSTLKDYSQLNGESGYFQHKFNVYGRKNKLCYTCGTVIESCVISGRSTFYCPSCQK